MSKVSGIDEAGRGSVFGSLFIVGVTLEQNSIDKLVKRGLKDSKLFSGLQGQQKRAELALEIQKLASELEVKEISASEIDQTLKNRPRDNLNYLEIRNIAKIKWLTQRDAFNLSGEFGETIEQKIRHLFCQFISTGNTSGNSNYPYTGISSCNDICF